MDSKVPLNYVPRGTYLIGETHLNKGPGEHNSMGFFSIKYDIRGI